MTKEIPVVVLAFADGSERQGGHLECLNRERRALEKAFRTAEKQGLCQLKSLTAATADDIFEVFRDDVYRDRIAVFHYSGHAETWGLLLKDERGGNQPAYAEGLMGLLADQDALQLVFLNGCFSAQQTQILSEGKVPAVVGTIDAVADETAAELSEAFYLGLCEGLELDTAWRQATLAVRTQLGEDDLELYYHERYRNTGFATATNPFPWAIRYKPGSEQVKNWSFPSAVKDYLFGLPRLSDDFWRNLPSKPYRFLQWFEYAEAPIFFGRNRYVRDLFRAVTNPLAPHLILLHGQSGVGKSSLLNAGMLPRLDAEHEVRIVRKDPDLPLSALLDEALGASPDTWAKAWLAAEQESGQPLVLVLDQVETVFTNTQSDQKSDLAQLLATLYTAFTQHGAAIRGRLVLAYRKEWHSDLKEAVETANLPYRDVYLERMQRDDIVEVVTGLASHPELVKKYHLEAAQIDAELPVVIADDLLVDPESPIAPVLQIILTKMWDQQPPDAVPQLRRSDYERLRKKGILLSDFFNQQMAKIKAWEAEINEQVESSGLALDLLNYHTSPLGASENRNLEDLRTQYRHREQVLEALLQKCKSLYLLTGVNDQHTTLGHDTLAPIVQQEMKNSDRPGQRALRILLAKSTDYQQNPDTTVIEEEDLTLVERGAGGMRLWVQKEPELIEKSRKYREKRQSERRRTRRLLWTAGVLSAVFAVVATVLWRISEHQKSRVETSNLYNEGRLLLTSDPTLGLAKISAALARDPADSVKLRGYYDAISNHIFYDSLWTSPGFLQRAAFVGGRFAYASDADVAWSFFNTPTGAGPRIFAARHTVTALTAGRRGGLCAGGQDRRVYRLTPDGQSFYLSPPANSDSAAIRSLSLSADERWLAVGHSEALVSLWDLQNRTLVRQFYPPANAPQVAISPDGSRIVAGDVNGGLWLYPAAGGAPQVLQPAGAVATSLTFSDSGDTLAAGLANGTVRFWVKNGPSWRADSLKAHAGAVTALAFSSDGRWLLSGSADHSARLWRTDGWQLYRSLLGHGAEVHSVGFDLKNEVLLTAATDGKVRRWPLVSPYPQRLLRTQFPVEQVGFSPDGQWLLGTEMSEVRVWSTRNFEPQAPYLGHSAPVRLLQFSPDNQHVATSDVTEVVNVWALAGVARKTATQVKHLADLRWSPDGQQLLVRSDSTVWLWRWASEEHPKTTLPLPDPGDLLAAADFGPDGQIVVATLGQQLHFFSAAGKFQRTEKAPGETSNLFGRQGTDTWALLTQPDSAWLWEGPNAQRFFNASQKVVWNQRGQMATALSQQGNQLCLLSPEGYVTARLFDAGSDGLNDFALHPGGQWLAAGVNAGGVWLWRVPEGQLTKVVKK